MQVLIAEDDPIALQILKIALQKMGHTVTSKPNGQDAWNFFQERPVNIVVSDWDMPGLDGLEFCRQIRDSAKASYTYFILLTGKNSAEEMTEAMDEGVDDFLPKPLNESTLSSRMRVAERIIDFYQQIRELKTIIPICSYCKKIRNDDDYWQRLENFLELNLNKDISHSICPECYDKHVEPQFKP